MPTREAIVDTVIPREVEKPIPVRTVSTRTPKPAAPPQSLDQPLTAEGITAAVSAPTAESVRLSPQLSALARKEQAFRQREQALKLREKEMEDKLAQAEKFNQLKTKLSAKDYSEAEAMGLNYQEYTEYLLNKAPEDPNAAKLRPLEEKVTSLEKKFEENTTKQFEATVAEYRKEIESYVGSTPGFEGLKDPENQKAILQLILDDFEKDGVETSIEQAAKDVKAYLAEQAKRLSVFLEKPPEAPVVEEKRQLPPPTKTQGLKTLTQQVTPGAADAPLKSLQHLPESERYAEARRRAMAKRDAALAAQGKR